MSKCKVIAVANQKGAVGKTTRGTYKDKVIISYVFLNGCFSVNYYNATVAKKQGKIV